MNIFFETIGRLFFILPSKPKTVQIEVTNLCNLNCKMCPRKFMRVEEKHMDFGLFKKIVDKLKGVKELILTGWGEPLTHPEISEMIKYCKNKGFKTRLTTNAVFLNEGLARKIIEAGLDAVTFSIDNLQQDGKNGLGHVSNLQVENIRSFAGKINRPKIILQATLHGEKEKDIFEIINFGKEIGADGINLVRLFVKYDSSLRRPDFREEKAIIEKAIKLGDKLGIKVECFHHSLGKGISRKIYKILKGFLHRRGRYCFKIYNEAYINIKGELTPCCGLPNYSVGSVLNESFLLLWKNKKFQSFRKNLKKFCSKCDAGQIKQF